MWSVSKRRIWSAPVELLRRNLIWRYTLFFAVISLLLMAVLFAVLYHLSIGSLVRQQQHDIELQASQQAQVAENMSRRHFIQFIERHNRSGSATILALTDSQGVLSFVPEQLSACPHMSHFPIWNDEFKHIQTLAGCITNTRHGELLVSLDAAPLQQIKNQLLRALAVVGGAGLILSLLLGWLFSKRVLKRLRDINLLCSTLMRSPTSGKSRLPTTPNGDEFDVTSRYINQMLDAVDHAMAQISGVTDTIAHDLRTPLTRLRMRLESLASRDKMISADALQPPISELDGILSTFKAMLELTRMQQQETVSLRPADLSKIVTDAAEFVSPLLEENGQKLVTAVQPGLMVQGNPELLFRLCCNLLENCARYAGKSAMVETRLEDGKLTVADNGPGIPENELGKVLERFYRVDRSRSVAGYGLGLAFVNEVCRLHNVSLKLSNRNPGLDVSIQFVIKI